LPPTKKIPPSVGRERKFSRGNGDLPHKLAIHRAACGSFAGGGTAWVRWNYKKSKEEEDRKEITCALKNFLKA